MALYRINIEPPIQTLQDYKNVHRAVNAPLNDSRFGGNGAEVQPLPFDVRLTLPITHMDIITRKGYVFTQELMDLLIELANSAEMPHALKFVTD